MAMQTIRCCHCGTYYTGRDRDPQCSRCGTPLVCWDCKLRFVTGETQYVARVDGMPRAFHEACQPAPADDADQYPPGKVPVGMQVCPWCGGAGSYAAHVLGAPGPCKECAGTGLVPEPVGPGMLGSGDPLMDALHTGDEPPALGMPPDETPDEMVRRLRHGMRQQREDVQPYTTYEPPTEPTDTSTADALEQWLKGLV